jgi:predicted HicB family RNase H-like nuclease
MESRKIDTKLTKQVRIERELHKFLKLESAKAGISIKTLIEGLISDYRMSILGTR